MGKLVRNGTNGDVVYPFYEGKPDVIGFQALFNDCFQLKIGLAKIEYFRGVQNSADAYGNEVFVPFFQMGYFLRPGIIGHAFAV